MEEIIKRTYDFLKNNGWMLQWKDPSPDDLPVHLKSRYHAIPAEWLSFISRICGCVNADENAWFLCANDFEDRGNDAFRWNELELMSLQAAEEEHDDEWKRAIMCFWNGHLPVYLSVAGEYEYYAIRMRDGVIVHGTEPEFEETTEIAPSFPRFLEMVCTGKIILN